MSRVFWTLLLVGALLVAAGTAAEGAAGPRPSGGLASHAVPPRVSDGLAARARREGSVRVVVRLHAEAVRARIAPGDHMPHTLRRLLRRARIAAECSAVEHELRGHDHRVIHRFRTLPWLAIDAGPDALDRLAASSHVAELVEDALQRPALDVSVPLIGASASHVLGFDGAGQTIAVLDTGVDANHPNLAGKVVGEACFASGNPYGSGSCPDGSSQMIGPGAGAPCDFASDCFHGTLVAGVAAGSGPEASGVAPGASVVSIQVFSQFDNDTVCEGSAPCALAWSSDQAAALEYVYESLLGQTEIAAVNMSIAGAAFQDPALCDLGNGLTKAAIDNLRAVGVATVAAAGNNGFDDALTAPACISSAISVGATRDDDVVAGFSNSAPFLDLFAPGKTIRGPNALTTGYKTASGTSFAAPHVAGSLAILNQAAPDLSVDQALLLLQFTGTPIARGGLVAARVDVRTALAIVLGPCGNEIDDDGDGLIDYPDDPGCRDAGFESESPACDDGLDNDGDGRIDWSGVDLDGDGLFFSPGEAPPDPACADDPSSAFETTPGCGLGAEVALLVPLLRTLRRRRRR